MDFLLSNSVAVYCGHKSATISHQTPLVVISIASRRHEQNAFCRIHAQSTTLSEDVLIIGIYQYTICSNGRRYVTNLWQGVVSLCDCEQNELILYTALETLVPENSF